MSDQILGIHHITAIAGNAKRNYEFYTKVLGLRLVKKTVNFDDPGTYHFYFGDEVGSPGTILTFFPWEGITQGKPGTGMATEIDYAVAQGSLEFWKNRFADHNVRIVASGKRFGEDFISIEDPDGLRLTLVIPANIDDRKVWESAGVTSNVGLKGFHSISLTLKSITATAQVLTDIFDYKLVGQEGDRYRFKTEAIANAAIVDLISAPELSRAVNAAGTIHHVAFRVTDESVLMRFREKIVSRGYNITPKIDRNYFFSLYFREPGGVLFELATDNPGFMVDEPLQELGRNLKLPAQYESQRDKIVEVLPSLD
jgi:glyoxalase family protein